jgi:hypothetical protein
MKKYKKSVSAIGYKKIAIFANTILCIIGLFTLNTRIGYAQTLYPMYGPDTARIVDGITIDLKAGKYEIKKQEDEHHFVTVDGFDYTDSPGDPVLPQKIFDVLVPPNVDWETVTLAVVENAQILEGTYSIMPAPPCQSMVGQEDEIMIDWGDNMNIVDGKNMDVYGNDNFFPVEPVVIAFQSQMRKWKFVRIISTPVQYNPVTGKVRFISSVRVQINFDRIGVKKYQSDPLLLDTLMDNEARQRFINFDDAQKWYRFEPGSQKRKNDDDPDYVIITTNDIVTGSGTGLTGFIDHKINLGHTVQVVTESDYGSVTAPAPNGTADKIRQWLFNNYTGNKVGAFNRLS